jgi:hypothetical protein
MAVEFINFIQHGIVFTEEEKLLKSLFERLSKNKKKFLVVRETWLEQETFEREIKNKKFDEIVTLSFMDTPNIDYNFLNNYPIHRIGYYKNSPHYFDFHSYMTARYLKIDKSITFNNKNISIPFMCLNGKPHSHREQFVRQILKEKLHLKNIVSFNSVSKGFSLTADKVNHSTVIPSPFDVHSLGDILNWKKHFLNVVTETILDNEKFFFITEKTYKPILGYKPFIVYSKNGSVDILNKFNFENYYNDFTDITDLNLKEYKNHINFLKTLDNQSIKYFQKKYKSFKEKILYNKNNFLTHQKNQINNLKISLNYIS